MVESPGSQPKLTGLSPGDGVRIVTTKWGDRPHWVFEGVSLGRDGFGDWVGFTRGTRFVRPGAEFVADHDHVTLVPRRGSFLATFWPDGGRVEVYVDVTTPPVWDAATLRVVDLDLDVVRLPGGQVQVEDEDEFAEHRVAFGYPADVVATARETCTRLVARVSRADPPFDTATPARWLSTLSRLVSG